MRFRSTGFLAILFVALLAFVYFYEIKGGARRERADLESRRVLNLSAGDLTRIEIDQNDTLLIVERFGEGWRVLAPVEAEGYGGTIDVVASSAAEFEIEGTAASGEALASGSVSLSDFGLDPAVLRTELVQSTRSDTLWFGAKSPTGEFVYVKWSGSPDVLMAKSYRTAYFDKTLFDLREKLVMPLDIDAVSRIRFEWGGATTIVSRESGLWRIEEPILDNADQTEVERLLNRIRTLRAKSFESETAEDLARFGLAPPGLRLTLTEHDAEKVLLFGDSVMRTNGRHYYAKYGAVPKVVTLDSLVTANMYKNVDNLRDKNIFTFSTPADSVDAITMAFGDSLVSARFPQEGGDWILDGSDDQRIVGASATKLVRAVRNLKAKTFVSETSNDLGRFGLDAPHVTLTLGQAGGVVRLLKIGKFGSKVYALREGRHQVVEIPSSFLDNLNLVKIDYGPAASATDGEEAGDAATDP